MAYGTKSVTASKSKMGYPKKKVTVTKVVRPKKKKMSKTKRMSY